MSSASRRRSSRSASSPRRGLPPATLSAAHPAAVLGRIRLANDTASILTQAAASAACQTLCALLRRHGSLLALNPTLVRAVAQLLPSTPALPRKSVPSPSSSHEYPR